MNDEDVVDAPAAAAAEAAAGVSSGPDENRDDSDDMVEEALKETPDSVQQEKPVPKKPKGGAKRRASDSTAKGGGGNKKKRRKGTPGKEMSQEEMRKREALVEKERAAFEEQKAEILGEVPETMKKRFGEICFTKFGKEWYPCLILSPYDVAPGGVRDQWMKMFENTKLRRDHMTYLVYYYGTSVPAEYYGFAPRSQIMTLEDGIKKGYDKLPKAVQKKLDAGKHLAKSDKTKLAAIDEMKEDLNKPPEERKRGEWPFEEYFERKEYLDVMFAESVEDIDISDVSDGDVELVFNEPELSDDDENVVEEEVDEKPKGKSKQLKKDKKEKENKEIDKTEEIVATDKVELEDIAEKEESAGDEVMSESSASKEDEVDEDFEEDVAPQTTKKMKAGKEKKKPAEKPKIQRKRTKKPKDTTPAAATKEAKSGSGKKPLSRKNWLKVEQERYSASVEECQPLLEKLRSAVKAKDIEEIESSMKELLPHAKSMSQHYIEKSGIVSLVKKAKALLKEKQTDMSTFKQLFAELKESYEDKKNSVPKGYNFSLPETKSSIASGVVESPKKVISKAEKGTQQEETAATKSTSAAASEVAEKPVNVEESDKKSIPVVEVLSPQKPVPPSPPRQPVRKEALAPSPLSRAVPHGSASSLPKSEKKSFLLSTLLRPKASVRAKGDETSSGRTSSTELTKEKTRTIPQWMTSAPKNDDDAEFSSDENRVFALEFFQAAAMQFPADKVNPEAIARALEAAVFKWSRETDHNTFGLTSEDLQSCEDRYWFKLHCVVGAISGKDKVGTLVAHMLDGKVKSPEDVVKLSDEDLQRSFEGQPMS